MSDKKPTSPIMGWFEAGLGLFTEQLNAANQQVQHKVGESQKTLDELAARGAEVEAQIRKTVDPSQWLIHILSWSPVLTKPCSVSWWCHGVSQRVGAERCLDTHQLIPRDEITRWAARTRSRAAPEASRRP